MLRGQREVEEAIRRAIDRAQRAARAGLYLAANNVATISMGKTPVDLGPLRGSTYVAEPEMVDGRMTCEVGVGGVAETYAVVQHEDASLNHSEGEDHFLLKAVAEYEPRMEGDVAAFVRQGLERDTSMALPSSGIPKAPVSGRGARHTAGQASRGRKGKLRDKMRKKKPRGRK